MGNRFEHTFLPKKTYQWQWTHGNMLNSLNREWSSNWNHRQDYTPNKAAKMKKSHHARGREQLEATSWWEYETVPLWQFLKKLNTHTSYDSTIGLLGIYLREIKYPYKALFIWMCKAALFIIAKYCKQRRCLSKGEWINLHLHYIHTVGC